MADRAAGRPMRRREREITDRAGVEEILSNARTLFLGFRDVEAPYLVPMSFGYEAGVIWVHSAAVGTKVDLLRRDPRVGFAAEWGTEIVAGKTGCDTSVRSRSVTGVGVARIVEDEAERRRGLDAVMRHYGWGSGPGHPEPAYEPQSMARTLVIRIDVTHMRGKRIGAGE
jgi:uncharacterized protein